LIENKSSLRLAWFGGDPHLQSLSDTDLSCNVYGSYIYAETTLSINETVLNTTDQSSTIVKALFTDELFSIIARTSKTQSLLRIDQFYNQPITYFSSFSMYLGSGNEVIINVDINTTNDYQFSKQDTIEYMNILF
jgi:hypothetical protein